MSHASRRAVLTAIAANFTVTVIKFIAGLASGSASMINEAVHSLMDTLNQGFLFLGLREAEKPADRTYAFGHGQKKYLWNLWSAIGLFSIGSGLGLAHAWHSWEGLGESHLTEQVTLLGLALPAVWLNLGVLAAAFLLEGYSFLVALREFLQRMRADGARNPFRYLARADDPTLVAVVLEDSAAMLGLALAALGILLTHFTGHAEYDILFSALIALMLGAIAFYLGFVNMRFLSDIRDSEAEAVFREVVARHPEVERFHDLRSVIIDERHTVLVAEIELREEAMVADLYDRIRLRCEQLLAGLGDLAQDESWRRWASARASVETVIARAEQIIDEIEARIRERLPRVSHITLEVEGVAPGSGAPAPAEDHAG